MRSVPGSPQSKGGERDEGARVDAARASQPVQPQAWLLPPRTRWVCRSDPQSSHSDPRPSWVRLVCRPPVPSQPALSSCRIHRNCAHWSMPSPILRICCHRPVALEGSRSTLRHCRRCRPHGRPPARRQWARARVRARGLQRGLDEPDGRAGSRSKSSSGGGSWGRPCKPTELRVAAQVEGGGRQEPGTGASPAVWRRRW